MQSEIAIHEFPSKDVDRVKYSMALIGKVLSMRKGNKPTENDPVKLSLLSCNILELRYLWTAAMVFGMRLDQMKFDHTAITFRIWGRGVDYDYRRGLLGLHDFECCDTKIEVTCFFGLNYSSNPVDQKSQMGWIDRFSSSSLYETKFKKHLTSDMIPLVQYDTHSEDLVNAAIARTLKFGIYKISTTDTLWVGDTIHDLPDILAWINSQKFESGPSIPHDGYLRLAFCMLEKGVASSIKNDPYFSSGQVLHFNYGDYQHPIWKALHLCCIHFNYEMKTQGKPMVIQKKTFSNFIERIRPTGNKSLFFSGKEQKEFKQAILKLLSDKTKKAGQEKQIADQKLQEAELKSLEQERIKLQSRSPQVIAADKKELERLDQEEAIRQKKQRSERVMEMRMEALGLGQEAKKQREELLRVEAQRLEAQRIETLRLEQQARKEKEAELRRYGELLKYEIKEISPSAQNIKKLLANAARYGAVIDYQDENGYTALMYAIDTQNDRIAEYLLKENANPTLRNKSGETARDLASSSSPIYDLLKQKELLFMTATLPKAEGQSILMLEYIRGNGRELQQIDQFLSSGANLDHQIAGSTALMIALEKDKEFIAEYLLKSGANPLIANQFGKIASDLVSYNSMIYPLLKGYELIFLTFTQDLNKIKLLLQANPQLIDFQTRPLGYSALLIAVEQEAVDIVEYLLSINADLDIQLYDKRGVFDLNPDNSEIFDLLKAAQSVNTDNSEVIEEGDEYSNSSLKI